MGTSTSDPKDSKHRDDIDNLIQKAKSSSAAITHSETLQLIDLPAWIDTDAISAGKDFVRRHFFLVFFTHFISLILLLSYIPVRTVLLKTKKSHTKELALTRYLSTLRHVKLWYEGDLLSREGSATRDVMKIRQIHSGVYQRLQECPHQNAFEVPKDLCKTEARPILNALRKCSQVDENNNFMCSREEERSPHIISQLDMMVTQYCFMGLLTTFPEKFGLSVKSNRDIKGLEGFVHIWAVIGHLLGIEEQFNIGLGDKTQLKKYILHEILLKDFATTGVETFVLWEALVSAMSVFVPCLSLRAALLFILEHTLEISQGVSSLYCDEPFYDIFCYKLTLTLLKTFFKFEIVRNTFNNLLRFAIYATAIQLDFGRKVL